MFVMLCPEGSEGVTYSLLTTISNLAGAVAYDIGTWLSTWFQVDNKTIEAGDYSGILYIEIVTTFLQLMPLAIVWMLPNNRCVEKERDRHNREVEK